MEGVDEQTYVDNGILQHLDANAIQEDGALDGGLTIRARSILELP